MKIFHVLFHVVLQKYASKTVIFLFVSIEIFTTELIGTKNVTLFLGHPVGADFRGMLLQKLFGKLDFLFKMVLVSYC